MNVSLMKPVFNRNKQECRSAVHLEGLVDGWQIVIVSDRALINGTESSITWH